MKNRIELHIIAFVLAASIFLIFSPAVSVAGMKKPKPVYGTISQIVQTRNGRKSCWGVLVQLNKLQFKDSLKASDLIITEAKHSSDLRSIMVWHVDKSKRTLTVEFKPTSGDFGSGNYMMIHIKSSGIVGSPKGGLDFSIKTDLESENPEE